MILWNLITFILIVLTLREAKRNGWGKPSWDSVWAIALLGWLLLSVALKWTESLL